MVEKPRQPSLDEDSVRAAYRAWALDHPGRYAATVPAPDPGDAENVQSGNAIVGIALDVLAGFGLAGDDAIDATRALRAALHGFVSLERAGGFGLPVDVNRSFDRQGDVFRHPTGGNF